MRIAQSKNLDLVEVGKQDNLSICKIFDYSKYKYEQKKSAKKPTMVKNKEIRYNSCIAEHDYNIKLNQAHDFLKKGYIVKFCIRLKNHVNLNILADKLKQDLSNLVDIVLENQQIDARKMYLQFRLK